MAQRLLNKVAVVTGASEELGQAVVKRFLDEGAKVVAFGGDRARLDELTARAAARVLAVEGDVTRGADLEGLAATVARRFGGVDVLVPAAEIVRQASLAESTPELVAQLLAVNVQGTLETLRVFERHLNAGASIVLASAAQEGATRPGLGPYLASKAALASLARALVVELSPRGIRINCVAPARTGAPIHDSVAEAILYLATGDAAGITGQEVVIDWPTARHNE
jgi:NAD(P)-dependent dehydrogenase (short-subunit alcohol dehydrogenase family)